MCVWCAVCIVVFCPCSVLMHSPSPCACALHGQWRLGQSCCWPLHNHLGWLCWSRQWLRNGRQWWSAEHGSLVFGVVGWIGGSVVLLSREHIIMHDRTCAHAWFLNQRSRSFQYCNGMRRCVQALGHYSGVSSGYGRCVCVFVRACGWGCIQAHVCVCACVFVSMHVSDGSKQPTVVLTLCVCVCALWMVAFAQCVDRICINGARRFHERGTYAGTTRRSANSSNVHPCNISATMVVHTLTRILPPFTTHPNVVAAAGRGPLHDGVWWWLQLGSWLRNCRWGWCAEHGPCVVWC